MLSDYAAQYLLVAALAVVAVVFGIAPLILARCLAPRKPSASKQAAYECGVEAAGDAWVPFRAQYYIYALLFVLFDVEVIFLFPWALVWQNLGLVAFLEMALFLFILFVGLVYAWRRGVLEWK
jgi:NADH:ubiquinone oxidoreductase subunit 3 (subunit A)